LVAELKGAGCQIAYDYEWNVARGPVDGGRPTGPAWVRRILGDDAFTNPTRVQSGLKTPDQVFRSIGGLSSLTSVELRVSAGSEPFRAIGTLSRLRRIKLWGPVDFHDLAQIPPMPSVTELSLRDACATDSSCALIGQKFPGLTDLFMYLDDSPQLSDDGLAAIRELPKLKRFWLFGYTSVSPAAISGFSGSADLEELIADLPLDRAAADGAVPCVRIHDCPALERLDILTCGPSDRHTAICHWSLFIKRVPQIKELRAETVGGLRLDDPSRLEELTLLNCDISAADLSRIVARAPLVKVKLYDFDGNLEAALQELGKVSSLRSLALPSNKLNASDVALIGSLKQLEQLDVSYNREIDDRCLQQLEQLGTLRTLTVYRTTVTKSGIRRIENAIPRLRCVVSPGGVISGKKESED
jgi:hypothetical protein